MTKDCAICKEATAKYKCPACLMGTCSLDCVQAHKKSTGCTGKRPRSDNVSVRNFTDSVLYKGMLKSFLLLATLQF